MIKGGIIDWISADESLPVVPEGKFAVHVLAIEYDPCFEEISPGNGHSVVDLSYSDVSGFTTCVASGEDGWDWIPNPDEVTHWAYWPEVPEEIKRRKKE